MGSFLDELIAEVEKHKPLERERQIRKPPKRSVKRSKKKKQVYIPQSSLPEDKRAIKRSRWVLEQSSIVGQYRHYKRSMVCRHRERAKRGLVTETYDFRITLNEWVMLWMNAGMVMNRKGKMVHASRARGRNPKDVRLYRHDPFMPWTIDNAGVWYGGVCISDGRNVKTEQKINKE